MSEPLDFEERKRGNCKNSLYAIYFIDKLSAETMFTFSRIRKLSQPKRLYYPNIAFKSSKAFLNQPLVKVWELTVTETAGRGLILKDISCLGEHFT